jgi:hypothetical protein
MAIFAAVHSTQDVTASNHQTIPAKVTACLVHTVPAAYMHTTHLTVHSIANMTSGDVS